MSHWAPSKAIQSEAGIVLHNVRQDMHSARLVGEEKSTQKPETCQDDSDKGPQPDIQQRHVRFSFFPSRRSLAYDFCLKYPPLDMPGTTLLHLFC